MDAYGLCGLLPPQFLACTVPEFLSMREAAAVQEARWMKRAARAIAQLLGPHLKEGTPLAGVIDGILGMTDPEAEILKAREHRLMQMSKRSE